MPIEEWSATRSQRSSETAPSTGSVGMEPIELSIKVHLGPPPPLPLLPLPFESPFEFPFEFPFGILATTFFSDLPPPVFLMLPPSPCSFQPQVRCDGSTGGRHTEEEGEEEEEEEEEEVGEGSA